MPEAVNGIGVLDHGFATDPRWIRRFRETFGFGRKERGDLGFRCVRNIKGSKEEK